jgi:hypothetical protein
MVISTSGSRRRAIAISASGAAACAMVISTSGSAPRRASRCDTKVPRRLLCMSRQTMLMPAPISTPLMIR